MASSSLWRSAGPLVVGRTCSAIIGFALPVILARRLDASEYGTYKQVYLVSNLTLYSLQLGLAQSLFYFVPRAADEEERRTYLGQTQLLLAVIGMLTFVALWLAVPTIAARFSNPDLKAVGLPLAVLAGALVASAQFEIALTSRGKPAWSAVALVASDVTRISGMLAALLLGYGLSGLVWAAALSAVARWVACVLVVRGSFTLRRAALVRQLTYSLPFGLAVLLLNQQIQLHQVFVSTHATPALFALYSVGCMQIPIVSLLYSPVSETLQVQLAALERTGETNKAGEVFSGAVDRLALIFLPLCALLMVTARPGLHFLYQGRYDDSAGILRIAVLSVAVSSLPVDGVLKARARTGTLLALYAAKLAITWPLLGLGYRLGGLEGCIGAHVSVELLTKLTQISIISWDLRLPIPTLLGSRALLRSLGVALAAGVASWITVLMIPRALWACTTAGLVASAIVGLEILRQRGRAGAATLAIRRAA
jgi:O-antigen/teichoic acid export membrane protein